MIFTILLRKYMLKRKEELFTLLFTFYFLFLNTNKLVASAAMAVSAYPNTFVLLILQRLKQVGFLHT